MVAEMYSNNSVFAPDVDDFSWDEPEPDEGQIQDEADQEIVDGLSSGQLTIPEEGMQRLANNRNARVQIQLSQNLTAEQKQDAISQSFAADTEIRRAAMPPPPEQIAASPDAKKAKLIAELPPDVQNKPWQLTKEGTGLEMPRGYKEPDAGGEGGQGGPPFPDKPAPVTNFVSSPYTRESPARIVTQQDYDALPAGSHYVNKRGAKGLKRGTIDEQREQHWGTHVMTRTTPDGREATFQFVESKTGGKWEVMPDPKPEKPEKDDPHDMSKPINQWKIDQDIRKSIIANRRAMRSDLDSKPIADPTQPEIDAVKKQYGLMPPAAKGQQGAAGGQANDKVSAAIQAARNGDKAAQNALNKRGIQWQQ